MTDEQKEAARDRLAKARESKGPAQYKNIHPRVLALPDDDTFSMKNVKVWIKEAGSHASSLSKSWRWNKTKGTLAQSMMWKGYVRNLKYYLEDGDYIDDYYGPNMEHRVKWKCVAMAYHPSGQPKRNLNTFYPDQGITWTKGMQEWEDEEWGVKKNK